MTPGELCQLITRRVIVRSREESDPQEFIVQVLARLRVLQEHCPVERMEAELIEVGRQYGLLAQGVEKPG